MRSALSVVLLCCVTLSARADDARAKHLFDAGVEAAADRHWSEAIRLLEASLAEKDRPACRFNLMVANAQLNRPLEVARHAIAFLASVEGRSHSEETVEVRAQLERAARALALLQAEDLPVGTSLWVDGAPPRVTDGRRVYVEPGSHRLVLRVGEEEVESMEVELAAGSVQRWPRGATPSESEVPRPPSTATVAEAAPPTPPAEPAALASSSRSRRGFQSKHLALGLGLAGATLGIAAVGLYAYAAHRANVLEDWSYERPGYPDAADRYSRVKLTIMPFALSGGAFMAASAALVGHRPRRELAVSLISLLLGTCAGVAGTALLARAPRTVTAHSELEHPTREAGALLLGGSLPLLSYGVRLQWSHFRARRR